MGCGHPEKRPLDAFVSLCESFASITDRSTTDVYCLGVIAPAWIWHGNALLLTGDDRELVVITVPLLAIPELRWRMSISQVRRGSTT